MHDVPPGKIANSQQVTTSFHPLLSRSDKRKRSTPGERNAAILFLPRYAQFSPHGWLCQDEEENNRKEGGEVVR